MASTEDVIQRLQESKPPATDSFTYLTIIEKSLSPEILPALRDILDDATVTSDIGWDMVDMLIAVPGSEECLERIARLGNPREVILKVLEVMELASHIEKDPEEEEKHVHDFITLVGMLGVLHRRLKVKHPSRFLHTTLDTVLRAYPPTSAPATAAIIDLIRSLSGRTRPPLPTRQSSTKLDTPFQETDMTKSAPDPEALRGDNPSEAEEKLCQRLVQAFVTCVIEAYVNCEGLEWAGRLVEYTWPERLNPRKPTMLQAFKEVPELQARDALIGQLVAAAGDVGLSKIPQTETKAILEAPIVRDPLLVEEVDADRIEDIKLSTGGFICLTAYRNFAADVFDAHHARPEFSLFPDHHNLLQKFLGTEPQVQIIGNPGTVESLILMAVSIIGHHGVVGPTDESAEGDSDRKSQYMSYHHLLTLVSVFHPNIRVRNAATELATKVLHADPDPNDRLTILEDLLENCMFATLQAEAVRWLREELLSAYQSSTPPGPSTSASPFSTSEAVEKLQYSLFPALTHLKDPLTPLSELQEYWSQNAEFHLKVANFALFLFGGKEGQTGHSEQTPKGMKAAVGERYVEPIAECVRRLQVEGIGEKDVEGGEKISELSLMKDALDRVSWQ